MYIELEHISKYFGTFKASDDVSFGIEKGKLVGLLGPSGSGKTTILRMLAGLEKQDEGDVIIDGKNVNALTPDQRKIGFVFQSYALFPYMTVYDNIAYGLKVQKRDKKFIKNRVHELLDLVGLPGVEKRYPNQLSGGQRQRIALARALAPQPEVLLLDEPFAAIDAKVRKELRTWLRETIDKVGITSIFVTHDQDEAIEIADEIIITNKGRIEQVGNPVEIYENPKTPFVAQFIGQSAVIKDFGKLKGFEKENDSQYGVIRPEFVEISDNTEQIRRNENFTNKDEFFQVSMDKSNALENEIIANTAADSAYEAGIIEEVLFRGNTYEIKVRIGDITVTGKTSVSTGKRTRGEHIKVLIKQLYIIEGEHTRIVRNKAFDDSQIYYI
ncbi:MAG: sulfate ABC transporter ATP-binding protein [Agathobacter sp.]|uniref:sulfate/molybdate ABC transporter ATP-binding protein n=1 Tax=Agathobacter sp. TaxID=2021311 RepID=UPI002E799C80|nr:sulfate ABC transporter ATP-binding protein [Agathobacter sp.]MEE1217787.1 sulfate ABC transporter ATP-binding protein [Agathobacter sp.]